MASSDIQKVKETCTKDSGDWEEWPYPTIEIESVVTGALRTAILAKLDRADDGAEVRLIEEQISSGYSDYTQDDECSIEVQVGGEEAWRAEYEFSPDSAMAKFLKEFASDHS